MGASAFFTATDVLERAELEGLTLEEARRQLEAEGGQFDPHPPAQVLDWDSPAAQAIMEQARAADEDPDAIVNGILAEFPMPARWNLGMRAYEREPGDRNTLRAKIGSGNPRRHLVVVYVPGRDLYTVRIERTVTQGKRRGEVVVEQEQTHVYGEDLAETAITLHGRAWEGSSR